MELCETEGEILGTPTLLFTGLVEGVISAEREICKIITGWGVKGK